jgi:hypothetical protein
MTTFYAKKKNVIAANTLMVNAERELLTSRQKVPLVVKKVVIAPKYLVSNKIFFYHP